MMTIVWTLAAIFGLLYVCATIYVVGQFRKHLGASFWECVKIAIFWLPEFLRDFWKGRK